MPQSMENYYQEAGRAGRDGENSQCVLLFSAQDVIIDRMLLDNKDFSDVDEEDEFLIRQRDIRRLQIMEGYCKTTGCLRNYILEYFGEKTFGPCDNCGNCHREYHETDMTREAKWVVNCVAETRGRYGLTIVLGTLLGAKRARLRELGADKYKSYGALNDHSEAELRALISQMTEMGYLYQTQERYSVLKLGDISPLRDENTHVIMRTYEEKEPDKKKKPHISLEFNSPLVALWSPTKTHPDCPFVCIEPWYGRCDSVGYSGELKDREWIQKLEPKETFDVEYKIIIE